MSSLNGDASRPFEAIVTWSSMLPAARATAPRPADLLPTGLPVIALTCIDPRLNRHFPEALGLREEQFIWLRNAGNIVTGPASSTVRSLALACAIKGGREIAIIGHTDCGVRKTNVTELIDRFQALGIPREKLPEDLVGFFGAFASERQNVIRAVGFVRQSTIIGPRVPVHGLLINVNTGQLEWVVNGYDEAEQLRSVIPPAASTPTEVPALASHPAGTGTAPPSGSPRPKPPLLPRLTRTR